MDQGSAPGQPYLRKSGQAYQFKTGFRNTAIPFICFQTFVEWQRFRGICYQAVNWIYAGQTKGRSRNDRYATFKVPVKDIYLYPLTEIFREAINQQRMDRKERQRWEEINSMECHHGTYCPYLSGEDIF